MRFTNSMSMFGDYKSYKKFAPDYAEWKQARNLAEAKREAYLQANLNAINPNDLQKSKAILRAIDVMDEFSQKRAEDMEIATESIVGQVLGYASMIGSALGMLLLNTPKMKQILAKNKHAEMLIVMGTILGSGIFATIPAFPLFAWAAKAEVNASRKGRFEAMRKELKDPSAFAILTPEQEEELKVLTEKYTVTKDKKQLLKNENRFKLRDLKEMVFDSKEYKEQRAEFEKKLEENQKYFDKELTQKEIEDAKKDQQLLTKLVEKIDIASQDYAENAELATTTVTSLIFGLGGLATLLYQKLASRLKLKQSAIPASLTFVAMLVTSIFTASIQKQASRVGRFKIKQELLKHPEKLVYVSDEKTKEIVDVEIKQDKKESIFKFLKNAWKNNKEFEKWKKTEGLKEKNLAKAMKEINLSEEQLKDAKRLQHNTFRTFNEVDEKSQKYAESVEAIGQSIQIPISEICAGAGALLGMKHLLKVSEKGLEENFAKMIGPMSKYVATIFLCTLPAIIINAFVTKEQKKASRVADMLAIKEMEDYRKFADYSRFTEQKSEVL